MTSSAYPLRIPSGLIAVAKLRAADEYTDQSTALRQLLYSGAQDYVLNLLSQGRISIGKAAELLNQTHYGVALLAKEKGIGLGATVEQEASAANTARKLLAKKR